MAQTGGTLARRLRPGVAWLGVLLFAALAVLATALLLWDAYRIAAHTDTLAALAIDGVVAIVIGAGLLWIVTIAWVAGSGPRGARMAAIAALVTLVVVRLVVSWAFDGVLAGEPGLYNSQGWRILTGDLVPWEEPINRPPGFVFVLAGLYGVLGRSAFSVEAMNVVFAIATGLVVFDLARRVYGTPAGAIALLLYALWPAGALMVTVRLPHTAYDLTFAAAAWVAIAAPRGWPSSALGGVILGLSQYLRPSTYLLVPLFMLARSWGREGWRDGLRQTAIPMLLAFLIVLVPIMAWHLGTRGTLDISTSASAGITLYHGTDIDSGGRWSRQARDTLAALGGDDLWARSAAGQRLAIERILDDPVGIAALALRKQVDLWGRETYGVRYAIQRRLASQPWLPRSVLPSVASSAFYAGLLLLTALGLWLQRRSPDALAVLVILSALMLTLVHGLVEVRDRYHAYLIPLLMPIAASTVVAIVEHIRRRRANSDTDSEPAPT